MPKLHRTKTNRQQSVTDCGPRGLALLCPVFVEQNLKFFPIMKYDTGFGGLLGVLLNLKLDQDLQ